MMTRRTVQPRNAIDSAPPIPAQQYALQSDVGVHGQAEGIQRDPLPSRQMLKVFRWNGKSLLEFMMPGMS